MACSATNIRVTAKPAASPQQLSRRRYSDESTEKHSRARSQCSTPGLNAGTEHCRSLALSATTRKRRRLDEAGTALADVQPSEWLLSSTQQPSAAALPATSPLVSSRDNLGSPLVIPRVRLRSKSLVSTPITSPEAKPSDAEAAVSDLLQAQLSQLMKAFSCKGKVSGMLSNAEIKERDLRQWLQRRQQFRRQDARSLADIDLRRVSVALQTASPLTSSLGFRFAVPGKNGTWLVSNLKGFKSSPVRALPVKNNVSWHTYVHNYSVNVVESSDGFVLRVQRESDTQTQAVQIEKCLRSAKASGLKAWPAGPVTLTTSSNRKKKGRVLRRETELLPAVIMRPMSSASEPRWTLIYLHGMGETALDNYADKPHYFHCDSISLKVLTPTAPFRELGSQDTYWEQVSKSQAARTGRKWELKRFNSWFDYLTDSGGKREDQIDQASLAEVREIIHGMIRHEAELLGGRFDRIILGGKSQGCCTALDALLRFPERLGGFVGVVGHLLSCTPLSKDSPQQSIGLHFFNEPQDEMMRWSWVKPSFERLKASGYNVHSRRCKDPEDHGHWVDGIEGRWIRSGLTRICDSSNDS